MSVSGRNALHASRACLKNLLMSLLFVAIHAGAHAQTSDRDVLRVPWAGNSGFGFTDADGTPRSFFIDLARMIAAEADFDIQLIEYPSVPAAVQSIRDGETELLAGAAAGVFSNEKVMLTGPVAEPQMLLFVRNDAPQEISFDAFDGTHIGAVRNTLSSQIPPPDNVEIVLYDDLVTAFAKLLHHEVDGVLALSSHAGRTLSRSGLEALIRPSAVPVREAPSFVVLRREHADLMPRIEAAIGRLEQDGRLEDLRNTWHIVPPAPIPDVLTVGVTHFPPYYVVEEDGAVSGFAVELIRELADRAGLELKFEILSLESWSKGPRIGAVDLLPARSVTPDEQELLKFTVPVHTINYVPFVRAEDAEKPLVPEEGRIGILFTAPLRDEIERDLGVALVAAETPEEAAEALESGTIDALFYPRAAFENYLATTGDTGRFVPLSEPQFRNDLAIALRPGLADLDQQLNVVIQGFIGSAQYRALATRWFDVPPFWTPERIQLAQYIGGSLLSAAVLLVLFLVLSGRQRALRHARDMEGLSKRLGAVLDTAHSAILGFNAAGDVVVANAEARAMSRAFDAQTPFPWPKDIAFLAPGDRTPLEAEANPIRRALSGSDFRGEVALMTQGDDAAMLRHVRMSSSPLLSAQAGDIATVVILDDVSDLYESRRRAEEQAQIAAAAQKQESIGKLTGGVAHDFNNLLAVILGNLEFLRDDETDPDRVKFTQAAINATMRGAELVRNMLAFARRSQIEPQMLDLNDIVRSVELLAARTVPASVEIETSLLAGLWKTKADRALTESALLNLILNARDAMEGTGRLTIETTNLRVDADYIHQRDEDVPIGRYVMLAVSDNGPGIPEEILTQIFEPFFSTKGPQGGSGLGLSMVHGFMKQIGGTVRVYTELGSGTTFKLYFPAIHESAAKGAAAQAAELPAEGKGTRILLVEDQADVLAALKEALERKGYTVVSAESGDLALEVFRRDQNFDLVVTDIVMPGTLQGPGLVKALRMIQPDIPAIFLSGYAEEATVHGNGLRPSDIRLMKPVQRPAFFAAIERAITQSRL